MAAAALLLAGLPAAAVDVVLDLGVDAVQCPAEDLAISLAAPVTLTWRCTGSPVPYRCITATPALYASSDGRIASACAVLGELPPAAGADLGLASGFEGPPSARLLSDGFEGDAP